MTLTRRRFLTLTAACAALPTAASAVTWQGRAFGAEVSLTISGPHDQATAALMQARRLIREVEQLFSLYDPQSALVKLNTTGVLHHPDARFAALMQAAGLAHRQTGGLFDPTVQPLWRALALGQNPATAQSAIGWDRVRVTPSQISLDRGQALTFNGIAQGFATDLVADALKARGLRKVLVNIGEHRGIGGPWSLAIADPNHGTLAMRKIKNGAIATSSPAATMLGNQGHILHHTARPQWSTVSVEAPRATVADSLSTAMVLADRYRIEEIIQTTDVTRVTLIDFDGNLSTL